MAVSKSQAQKQTWSKWSLYSRWPRNCSDLSWHLLTKLWVAQFARQYYLIWNTFPVCIPIIFQGALLNLNAVLFCIILLNCTIGDSKLCCNCLRLWYMPKRWIFKPIFLYRLSITFNSLQEIHYCDFCSLVYDSCRCRNMHKVEETNCHRKLPHSRHAFHC